jgi:hypothetical protein
MEKKPELPTHIFDPFTGEHLPQCIARDTIFNQMIENQRLAIHPVITPEKLTN